MKVSFYDFVDDFEQIEDKEERAYFILDNIDPIVTWYIKKAFKKNEFNNVKELTQLIGTKKFYKAFKKAYEIDPEYAIDFILVIGDCIENNKRVPAEYQVETEMKGKYAALMEKMLSDKSKIISKKTNLPPDLIINLLVTMPTKYHNDFNRFVTIQANRVNQKIYKISAGLEVLDEEGYFVTPKQIKNLYTELFGKEALGDIAVTCLLDKADFLKGLNKRQKKFSDAITSWALETINKAEKEEVLDLLSCYIIHRRDDEHKKRDGKRRVELQQLKEEDYPKIVKGVRRLLSDKPEFTRFL